MYNRLINCVIYSLFLYVIVRQVESSVIKRKDAYESLTNELGLYNASDKVILLNVTNFWSTISNSKTAYLVQFYNSWCGHCQKFAPFWKDLANSIVEWNDIVNIAAIDCANDDNNPLCRYYEIMYYPLLRYFSPSDRTKGTDVGKDINEELIKPSLIKKLQKDQQDGKGISWPNIAPFRSGELVDAWRAAPKSVKYFFFVFEKKNSTIGSELILDMHRFEILQIRRILSDNPWVPMYKVTTFPTLIVLDRQNVQTNLELPVPSKQGITQVIKDFLQSKGLSIETKKPEIGLYHLSTNLKEDGEQKVKKLEYPKKDLLYQADLESALRYSLEQEIPLKSMIEGIRMEALKKYLQVLSKYFPVGKGNLNYLPTIHKEISKVLSISGEKFRELVITTQKDMAPVYTEKKKWIGCKGSSPIKRRYPCGLWTLFHTLTVEHAAKYDKEDPEERQPIEVLAAMYGYIKSFFGCSDCVQHFLGMADEQKIFDIEYADDAVLWLWRAHNSVNVRLSGDPSEDPDFPKIRYPPLEYCETCRNNDYSWNEDEVLIYLKRKYGYSIIHNDNSSKSSLVKKSDYGSRAQLLGEGEKYMATQRRLGWDLTFFDISICVVLYVISVAILILLCIKFAVKRSDKKKSIIRFLGRV